MKKKVKEILEALYKDQAPKLAILREMPEGMMGAEMDAPAESTSADDQIKAAFRSAVMAAFDDEKLDSKATLAKIKEILAAYDKLKGEEAKPKEGEGKTEESKTPATPPPGTVPLSESARLKLQLRARDLCADAGITPNKILRKALDACEAEPEMVALIEEYKAQQPKNDPPVTDQGKPGAGGQQVRSSGPGTNGAGTTASIQESFDDSEAARQKRLARFRGSV